MQTSSNEMLKAIPDFDEFKELSKGIASLMLKKLQLDSKIKEAESEVFKVMTSDEKYFVSGKPASMSYIENTYKHTGIDNELPKLRNELYSVLSELEEKRLLMDVYKSMLDVWRTLSSNERSSSI